MIFVDTNYFLRFLLKDDSSQHRKAKELFVEGSKGKIKLTTSTLVVFEIYWVMTSFYEKTKKEAIDVLEKVLSLKFIKLAERDVVEKALEIFETSNLEFEDCYNIVYSKDIKEFATFDRKIRNYLSKKAKK